MTLARWTCFFAIVSAIGATSTNAWGDEPPVIEEVTVVSTRAEQAVGNVPAAVSVIGKQDVQRARQQLGLDESLSRVPGVFAQNRYNFAQDLRIAIRGFGARAAFGIRGVKIFADGIPSTTADGQSGVDDIDLGSIERVEVVRGPSGALYGASAGGVINLISEDGPEDGFVSTSITGGQDHMRKFNVKAGGQTGRLNSMVSITDLSYAGYRDNANVEATQLNSKFRYDIDDASDLTVVFNMVDSPTAEDAGAITSAQADADPAQAQPRNLSSNAGEEIDQQKLGLVYRREFGSDIEMTVRNYYVWRDFSAFLPIGSHIRFVPDDGVVEFDRFFYGGGVQFNFNSELGGMPNRTIVGLDIDMQEDDRQRYVNDAGVQGALTFDQIEEAEAFGLFVRNETDLNEDLTLVVGARFDQVDLSVDDQFLTNEDQSSDLDFDEVSPMVGLIWRAADSLSVYANYGSSFETPTFTELASPARDDNPVSFGGFSDVSPQDAQSLEVGMRGSFWNDRVFVDVAAYAMEVEDEITSVANIGTRSEFRNADTDRAGLEVSATANLADGLRLTLAYTYSDFEFDCFPLSSDPSACDSSVTGNSLPGLPEHQAFAEIVYDHSSGLFAAADILYVDELYTNNSNAVTNDSSVVANVRAGHEFELDRWRVTPFIGITNVTNEEYNANVRINAFGGRLFEPGPERTWYGGVTVDFAL